MPDFGNFIKVIQVGSDTAVIDDLVTGGSSAALSAEQGKILNDKIDALGTVEHTAADIATMNANVATYADGDRVFIVDASADATVTSGWAIYRHNAGAFLKLIEEESLDLTLPNPVIPALQADVTSGTAVADSYVQSDTLKVVTDTKVDKPSNAADAGKFLVVNATGDDVELVESEEGLRGAPVADNTALTALVARNYERRKVLADGKEYVFELGAVSGTLADDATTGFWIEQGAVENFATADLSSTQNRLHTFDDVLQIIGEGQKDIVSDDGAGRTAFFRVNQGTADLYVSNTTGANSSLTGIQIINSNGTAARVEVVAVDPVTGFTSGVIPTGDELRIFTPEVDQANAVVGQVLRLNNANGASEFSNVEYTHDFALGDWTTDGLGNASISITAADHGLGLSPTVELFDANGPTLISIGADYSILAAIGDVTITIAEEDVFAGKAILK